MNPPDGLEELACGGLIYITGIRARRHLNKTDRPGMFLKQPGFIRILTKAKTYNFAASNT